MILEEEIENYIINPERAVKIQMYNPNIRFQNRAYYNRFRHNIVFKNYRALISLNKKLESLIMEEDLINVHEELELLYQALDFDPTLYKQRRKKLGDNPEKREICKEIVAICDAINKTSKATVDKIRTKYNELHPNDTKSHSFINKHLKMANYTFKKCSIKNPKICCDSYYLRKLYVIDVLTSKMLNDYIVISTDETPLNTIGNSDYYWTSNDCRQVFKKTLKKTGHSMLMCVGFDKVYNYEIFSGKNNAEKFWTFINNTLIKLSKIQEYKIRLRMGKVLIFMDNASIHRNFIVRDGIIKFDIELLYNVPYESSFNPIERVFRAIKNKIVNDLPKDIDEIRSKYNQIIEELQSKIIVNSWISSIRDMSKSMKTC